MYKTEPHVRSEQLYARALRVIPGGVNSPVRAFRAVGGTPIVVARGSGPYIFDVDGNRYLDFVGSWGPLILGHAHPKVIEAINQACRSGTTFGAPCPGEVELAERVVAAYPGLEQVRFVSSGTEATMSAIRLARAATGRDLIVKFSGCYHGHADHLLVAAGSGLATFGTASSAGVPAGFVASTCVLPLDDEQALRDLFAKEGAAIAAVIIEPVPANHGLLLQRTAFLHLLREETRRHGALLIFDEVISGFRVARGGAAEHYRITPDMATFGKIVGGGMPVGAFGASRAIMRHLAPDGGYLPGRHAVRKSRRHGCGYRDPRHPRARAGLGAAGGAWRATRAAALPHRRHGAFSTAPGAPGIAAVAVVPRRAHAAARRHAVAAGVRTFCQGVPRHAGARRLYRPFRVRGDLRVARALRG